MDKIYDFILYRNFEEDSILHDMTFVMENYNNDFYNVTDMKSLLYDQMNALLELAQQYGFEGNLWHNYIAFLLANNENAYSTSCEIIGEVEGSMNEIVKHDFAIFMSLFQFDFNKIEAHLKVPYLSYFTNYTPTNTSGKLFNTRIKERICTLSKELSDCIDVNEFKAVITQFYKDFGVGKLGLHKAFRIEHTNQIAKIVPITNTCHVKLEDLVGYELQKKKLIDNTEAFVKGKQANNCLLFGDAGTGKSTSIKAILNQYYDQGLRMIEIYKHQFQDLTSILAQIKNRNYKFIIFMDDLSFEEFETEYKYLKAVIEGGLEKKPDNVLIYATSNRRHLIREKFSDKEERRDDLHSSDTVQEKLSLAYRFGVSIFFIAPDKREYMNIVEVLANKYNLEIPKEELFLEANRWELSHGGLSGRTAQQFIDYLLGKF